MDPITKSLTLLRQLAPAVIGCYLVYVLCRLFYNLFYGPLARFPGPLSTRFTNAWYCYWFLGGRQPYHILDLHQKYGPVVRTAPNELSFDTAGSWRDIYDVRKGHQTFVKSPFYDGGSFAAEAHSIVSVRDPEDHRYMKKYLSHAFSDRSLKDQEYLITEVVDELIERIGQQSDKPMDLTMWFNLTTFDIIGSLAFGESFGGVRSGTMHFWIAVVIKALRQGALADCFARFPLFAKLFKALFPGAIKTLVEDTKRHEAHTLSLVDRRLAKKSERKDFLSRIIENQEEYRLSNVQIAAHSSDFVVAGSETTATTLATITYYLLKTPRVLKLLQDEIRTTFKSYEEIDATTTIPLQYLHAVALEGMRILPPLPLGLPRLVPESGDTVDGHFLPGGTIVSTNPLAACLSETNFEDPWEFKPERWTGKNERDVLDASQPFSMGTRACMGRSLGWMELRTILAKLHFTFDMTLVDENLDWHREIRMNTLWTKPELWVKAKRREVNT